MLLHLEKYIILVSRKVITQFVSFFYAIVIFNEEYFPNNSLKMCSSEILEKLIFVHSKEEFIFFIRIS